MHPLTLANRPPCDPWWQVLEFESLGIRVKNTSRFWVMNPTSIAYEFVWQLSGQQVSCLLGHDLGRWHDYISP